MMKLQLLQSFLLIIFIQLSDAVCYGQLDSLCYQVQITVPFDELKKECDTFRSEHSDLKFHVVFHAPNGLLRIGECGTLKDAEMIKQLLI